MYNFDIRKLTRRYVRRSFRHPINLSLAYVYCRWLMNINKGFEEVRRVVAADNKYNGLLHSLEWMLNDRFDLVQRRIYITVPDQVPVMYFVDAAMPPLAYLTDAGDFSMYHHLDVSQLNAALLYRYEFLVHIPAEISVVPQLVFDRLSLYRYAGRRPAIRFFNASNTTVGMHYIN